ncbi:MAG: hypothetical protein ACO3GM_04185 [Candidatus Limnocylindrus sp.]
MQIDTKLARIYAGHIEATYVGPGDAWEVDDGDTVRRVPAREVPAALGASDLMAALRIRHCMRVAVAETDDPAEAMGEAGPVPSFIMVITPE